LGEGVGPLLVANEPIGFSEVEHSSIAIPGENTTANFLLSYAFPLAKNKVSMLFSSIEDAVCDGKVDLGVIIHENRFTYEQKGLYKVCDLGEVWEEREAAPIPLACIAIRKTLPDDVKQKVNRLVKKSVEFAFANYPQLSSYVTQHAQAMDEDVMRKHIQLYVNNYTIELDAKGRKAIEKFAGIYTNAHSESITARASA